VAHREASAAGKSTVAKEKGGPAVTKPAGPGGGTSKRLGAHAMTPWGPATVIEEARVAQRAGDKRFASVVQLLEGGDGRPLVRVAYTTDGVARRGPVTLRARDLERLRAALDQGSALAEALGWSGGDA
jgi:hypothetical protein